MSEYLRNVEAAEAEVKAAKKQLQQAEKAKKKEVAAAQKRLKSAQNAVYSPQNRFAGIELYLDHLIYNNREYRLDDSVRTDMRIKGKQLYMTISTTDGIINVDSDKENESKASIFIADVLSASAHGRQNQERALQAIDDAAAEVQAIENDRRQIEDCQAVLQDKEDALQYLIDTAAPHEKDLLDERNKKQKKQKLIIGGICGVLLIGGLSSLFSKKPEPETTSYMPKTAEKEEVKETEKEEPVKEEIKEEVKEEETAPEPVAEEPEEEASSDGIRPEFREAMESYEEFFDEYIEFMELVEEDSSSPDILMKYYDYLNQYTETMEKLEAIDESELSYEEDMLYLETLNRINMKLYNAAQ